jgi:hypothetical protein
MFSLLLPLALLPLASAQANFDTVTTAHSILGCLAWVIFFPLGAVTLRLLNSPKAWFVHAVIQLFAYLLVVVNTGTGIWMGITSYQVCGTSAEERMDETC